MSGQSRGSVTPPSAVSLFSGCGGFCEGVKLAGFSVRAAVEFDRFAAETYRHNFPEIPLFEGDIRHFIAKGTDHIQKYDIAGVDLVFGGPPCQGYSQIGTRDPNDHRNQLYQEFARVVAALKPSVFLMENVPNLLSMNQGMFRDRILEKFVRLGYRNTTYFKLSAADFGVPQLRQRVIFVGTRDDISSRISLKTICEEALQSQAVQGQFVVKDALDDLPKHVVESGAVMKYPKARKLSAYQRMMRLDTESELYPISLKRTRGIGSADDGLHNHHTKDIQERRRKLIGYLKPGAKADSLPKRFWDGTRPEKWRRLHPERTAYTILAHMHRDLSEWVHPRWDRWITVREAARLQSFHDGFVFKGSEWQQLKQIGNAVPPLLGLAAGRMAYRLLQELRSRHAR